MRRREPFYKKSHKAWYVQLEGRQIRLGTDEKEAWAKFDELMVAQKRAERFIVPGVQHYSLGKLVEEFLASGFQGRAAQTKVFYSVKLLPFVGHLGQEFPVSELKPFHVEQWISAHPSWKKGTARTVWQAVKRIMRWGEKSGRIPHSTVCDYEKPGASRRTVIISPADYEIILSFIRSDEFRCLVTVVWEVGCRPQELLKAEIRHYDVGGKRIVYPPEEAKGGKWPRIVYLTEIAALTVKRLINGRKEGRLFLNQDGQPWTTSSVNCEFVRLQHRMGYVRMRAEGLEPSTDDIAAKILTLRINGKSPAKLREEARRKCRQAMASKLAPKYGLYHFRHSWLDRMLKAGVDVLTCAILMGHRDPSMIAKTYQHLSQSPDYLREALKKVAG
jgi:integrase